MEFALLGRSLAVVPFAHEDARRCAPNVRFFASHRTRGIPTHGAPRSLSAKRGRLEMTRQNCTFRDRLRFRVGTESDHALMLGWPHVRSGASAKILLQFQGRT